MVFAKTTPLRVMDTTVSSGECQSFRILGELIDLGNPQMQNGGFGTMSKAFQPGAGSPTPWLSRVHLRTLWWKDSTMWCGRPSCSGGGGERDGNDRQRAPIDGIGAWQALLVEIDDDIIHQSVQAVHVSLSFQAPPISNSSQSFFSSLFFFSTRPYTAPTSHRTDRSIPLLQDTPRTTWSLVHVAFLVAFISR